MIKVLGAELVLTLFFNNIVKGSLKIITNRGYYRGLYLLGWSRITGVHSTRFKTFQYDPCDLNVKRNFKFVFEFARVDRSRPRFKPASSDESQGTSHLANAALFSFDTFYLY